MFARLTIQTNKDMPDMDMPDMDMSGMQVKAPVVIPREALIRTGRSERVILALGDGKYQPAKVVSGQEIGDDIEILSGLNAGERIVVSSQFLIDSEASLRGTMLRLTPQESEMDMSGQSDDTNMNMPDVKVLTSGKAMGTVLSVMQEHGMITINHEPIEALNWPSMAMPFITEPELLKNIKEGDHVSITVLTEPDDSGTYILSDIKKMDMNQKNSKGSGQ